jgi:hypothetical protein
VHGDRHFVVKTPMTGLPTTRNVVS